MSEFYIFFVIMAVVGAILILSWYRRKELQALKAIELQILAAENNLDYREDGSFLTDHLKRLDIVPGPRAKVKNVLSGRYGSATTRIFDASYIVKKGKSSQTISVIGVMAEFNTLHLPQFELKPAKVFDGFRLFGNMQKTDCHLLPNWAQTDYSVFHSKSSQPSDIAKFFSDKYNLTSLIKEKDFHMLTGSNDSLVFYQKGALRSDLSHHQQLEQRITTLIDIFDPSAARDLDVPHEIKITKNSQQK